MNFNNDQSSHDSVRLNHANVANTTDRCSTIANPVLAVIDNDSYEKDQPFDVNDRDDMLVNKDDEPLTRKWIYFHNFNNTV